MCFENGKYAQKLRLIFYHCQMKDKIENTYENIKQHLNRTPLLHNRELSEMAGCTIYLKCENLQHTGSFKLRGAASKLYHLTNEKPDTEKVATASTGNHAAGVLQMSKVHGIQPVIFVPENVAPFKLKKLKKGGVADVRIEGEHCGITETNSLKWATENNIEYISPYNDEDIIAGQGTIGLELMESDVNFDMVFVPVGGGGLISGISSYIKSANPNIKIIGVQPENDAEMSASIKAGEIITFDAKETLSDGTAGPLEANSITFDYCQKYVDGWILISEKEIAEAVSLIYKFTKMKVEGAAGLTLAAVLKSLDLVKNKNCALVVCGAGIDEVRFEEIIGNI